jgi:hypothetical protein
LSAVVAVVLVMVEVVPVEVAVVPTFAIIT